MINDAVYGFIMDRRWDYWVAKRIIEELCAFVIRNYYFLICSLSDIEVMNGCLLIRILVLHNYNFWTLDKALVDNLIVSRLYTRGRLWVVLGLDRAFKKCPFVREDRAGSKFCVKVWYFVSNFVSKACYFRLKWTGF